MKINIFAKMKMKLYNGDGITNRKKQASLYLHLRGYKAYV